MELLRKTIAVNNRNVTLMPFGDLQKGDEGFRQDLFDRWKRDALEKNAWIIGMGDYSNTFRPTINKKIQQVMNEDAEAHYELDTMVMKEMQELADELKPFKSKIIGLLEGHHFFTLQTNMTSTQYLCQLLRVPYLGFVACIQLVIRRNNGTRHNVDIFATHGCGGASSQSLDLANLERKIMPYWDCDIFLRGHSTRVYGVPGAPLNYFISGQGKNNDLKIMKKQRWLVNCGGFMDGYVKGKSSYVEQKNLAPCALGYVSIEFHFASKKDCTFEIIPQTYVP